MTTRQFVRNLSPEDRDALSRRLHNIQAGSCYICQSPIDLQLHAGTLELDHINPLATDGRDNDMDLALTHAECNRNKGATDLRVARCLRELSQVAFDKAVMRHLGSTLYGERVRQYQSVHGLGLDDYSFSERDLVNHFRAERRQIERYIVDAQRDFITYDPTNKLFEFIERSGRGTDRPMSYATVDRAFFPFIYQKSLNTQILDGDVRAVERNQMTRLMNIFAETFYVSQWDPDIGGRRIETRILQGESIPDGHLRAWRISRDEVAVNVLRWVRRVIDNFFANTGRLVENERLLLEEFPEMLWGNITRFLERLAELPCWVNPSMSSSVFGPKQNFDYWDSVFKTGNTPQGAEILPRELQLLEMIAPD